MEPCRILPFYCFFKNDIFEKLFNFNCEKLLKITFHQQTKKSEREGKNVNDIVKAKFSNSKIFLVLDISGPLRIKITCYILYFKLKLKYYTDCFCNKLFINIHLFIKLLQIFIKFQNVLLNKF